MINPALLKLELIAHGIAAGPGLPEPLANPFGLVHLVLPEELTVSVHLAPNGSAQAPNILTRQGAHFFLETASGSVPVQWTPPLKGYGQRTSSGVLVSDILTVHGRFIAIHPSHPCRFGLSGLSCRYCGSSKQLNEHPPFTKRDMIEAISIVLREKKCDVVHLSSGHVETEDGGLTWLIPWVAELRKHLNLLVSLDLAPPANNEWIDETYAMGVDALYYDTDFLDPLKITEKKRGCSEARHLEALAYAAKIFPSGAVLSHIVTGLEPLEKTQEKINQLTDRGVIPILVYFPPLDGTELKKHWMVTPEQISHLYAHLYERLVRTRMTLYWIQQKDVVLTPLEGRFFSPQSARYHLALKKFYETPLGRAFWFGMASLRRHLRVREIPAP